MTIKDLIINFIFSFAVTAGFSIFFNAPKKSLIPCGIVGGIGWCTYVVMANSEYISNVFSMVIASAVISLLSEILARKLKYPSINFIIPGILPLVPGLGLYNTKEEADIFLNQLEYIANRKNPNRVYRKPKGRIRF